MNGTSVSFNGKHCLEDLGMVLTDADIGLPDVRTTYIDVPGRNGLLDLTEAVTGEVGYKNRTITLTLQTTERLSQGNWAETLSKLSNLLHGKETTISFDTDESYYYTGRCAVDQFSIDGARQSVKIVCDCQPYKMEKRMREYTVSLSVTGDQTVDVTGENVSKQDWNVDFRWGTAEIPTFNWSDYNSITISYTTYPNRSTKVGLQIVDADDNVYNNSYTKTAKTEQTGTIIINKSALESEGITWENIYRLLLQNVQSATVTASISTVASVKAEGTYKPTIPIIDTDIACTMTVKGQTYELEAGTWSSEDLVIDSEGATFTFKAENPATSATASVKFRGGQL